MQFDDWETPLQQVALPVLEKSGVELFIKRADLLHPRVSGNKWYKLKYNLQAARELGLQRIVSFGGAYSNHLHALAWAGHVLGLQTIGLVRGERHASLNPTLQDAENWGMTLHFLSRSDYRRRYDADFQTALKAHFEPCYLLPEGGANTLALRGCGELMREIDQQLPAYDVLCVPCGSGATLAGMLAAARVPSRVLGFAALRGGAALQRSVQALLGQEKTLGVRWRVVDDFHCGGFARLNEALVGFMQRWQCHTGIALDPIYTGKMLLGLMTWIDQGVFARGTRIVAVHTGGLQGLRGMADKISRLTPAPEMGAQDSASHRG